MKKFCMIVFSMMLVVTAFAGPHGGRGGHGGGRGHGGHGGPPSYYHGGGHHNHHGGGGNSGIRLATDIVNLVGASLNLISPGVVVDTGPTYVTPTYVAPTPTYVAPQPVYIQPAPQVVYSPPPVVYYPRYPRYRVIRRY